MELDIQKMIFEFVGGLGIFLFGIKYMGDGLQKVAGNRLRDILNTYTSNPIMGVFAGILVTALIQSSSATTVLTVGLVNARFMTLKQAIGIIMGANIGTTITAFLIGIDISDYSLPILGLGSFLVFFFKNQKINSIGQISFGFGALFFGLDFMGEGMSPLKDLEMFDQLMVSMSENPLLGVVIGTVFTSLIQSSSATIGILQELFAQHALDLHAALPVLLGDNIGTTITAILASIGASVAARRTALVHILFNIFGTVIFLFILGFYVDFVQSIKHILHLNSQMTIAFAHGTFNVTNTIIFLPMISIFIAIVTKLIPGENVVIDSKPHYLDPIFIEKSPSIAFGQAQEEILRMAKFAKNGLEEAYNYLDNHQKKHLEMAMQIEDAINNLDCKITDYLIKLSSASLTKKESELHSNLMGTVRDIERIGDHIENITEFITYIITNKVVLSTQASKELNSMVTLALSTIEDVIEAIKKWDKKKANMVIIKEEQIDAMERTLRKKHIQRLNHGQCIGSAGVIYVDILSNLERIGDHCTNIAEAILES